MWRYNNLTTLAILGPLAFTFAFALDVYVPALPAIKEYFNTTTFSVQLTMSAFFIVNGLGQLAAGPFADYYGRRNTAIVALIIYIIASLLCTFAPSINWLIAARILQAVGACALVVVAYAVIRDVYSGNQSGKMYSYLNGTISISPLLAPIVGSYLDVHFGWRACFVFLTVLACASLAIIFSALKETNPTPKSNVGFAALIKGYSSIVRNRQFFIFAMASSAAITCFFTSFSTSSIIYIQLLHTSEIQFSYFFAATASCSIIASFIAGMLCERVGLANTLLVGGLIITASGLGLILLYQLYGMSILNFLLPTCLMSFGCTLVLGAAAGSALHPFKHLAGSAAAMLGFLQFTIAAVIATAVLSRTLVNYLPIGYVVTIMGLVIIACKIASLTITPEKSGATNIA